MNTQRTIAALTAVAWLASAPLLRAEQPAVDPEADRLFKASCQYLAAAQHFGVKVEVWRDFVAESGTKMQLSRTVQVQHQRPNRLQAEVRGQWANQAFWYDGQSLTMLDRAKRLYGVMPARETLEKTIDLVEDKFGVEIPLTDVLVEDPYQNVVGNIQRGLYLGKATVLGVVCHHLVFNGVNADFQVWVADSAQPLPRKIVINFKTQTGSPAVTQIFTDWDLVSPIASSVFQFVEPAGAFKITVNPKQVAAESAAQE